MENVKENKCYLELTPSPVRFEPVSKMINVFFDDTNRQVFAVRSGGAAGVVVKGPEEKRNITFRMADRGDVVSIKFSYDMKILAIQRSKTSVEFINFTPTMETTEYSQSCKGKSTEILGFSWTNINEIVFVTDNGIEFYQVFPEKHTLKQQKSYSVPVNWYTWLAESAMLLLSSGVLGNIIHPFHFRAGSVLKLPKFEVDLPAIQRNSLKLSLFNRDVTMANIYGELYIVVLRHQPRIPTGAFGAEIALYKLPKESQAKKTDVLKLDMSGRFAVNVVDNLVVVHHQTSKTSLLFDIKVCGKLDQGVTYHQPVITPLPMKPFTLTLSVVPGSSGVESEEYSCELYSQNWIVFQPNIIIDAKHGCLWTVQLQLEPMIAMIEDKCLLVDLLLQRRESKDVVLKVCQQMLLPEKQCNLGTIASIFDKLNLIYSDYLQAEMQALATESPSTSEAIQRRPHALIDQSDFYTHVFTEFVDNKDIHYKFMVSVLVEYIRSLNEFNIAVQHYLNELIINKLVQHTRFYQLHQFLQYHVLSDSKHLACLLLSLEGTYPPAHQLALDMLKRLSTADEEIIEVLLSKQQLITALRFIKSVGKVDQISARKFLDAAKNTGEKTLFFNVFKFFEQRNMRLRGNPEFAPGEHCLKYVDHFRVLFGGEAFA